MTTRSRKSSSDKSSQHTKRGGGNIDCGEAPADHPAYREQRGWTVLFRSRASRPVGENQPRKPRPKSGL